jgi:RimJ/RimL family protein N-acetyltransferase
VELHLTGDLEEFAARAGALLEGRLEHNQLATVLLRARSGFHDDGAPLFAFGEDEEGVVRYAALRTPPWPMLTSIGVQGLDVDELMERWLAEDPGVPGVIGELRIAGALAAAWERATGGRSRVAMRSALHVLERLEPPARPASGRLRLPVAADRELLIEWEEGFLADAGIDVELAPARLVDARLAARAQLLWDDEGPVSTLATSPEVARTVRIGPVYTPPGNRGRGYASSAVAEVCRRSFEGGAKRCALFTDLANPTSNRIYGALGFRPVADWAEIDFER